MFDSYKEETINGSIRTQRTTSAQPTIRLVEGRVVPLPKHLTNFVSLADNKKCCLFPVQAPTDRWIIVVVAGRFREEFDATS